MSQPLIFITGATGFIGSHVVQQTLAAGYKVRLSVRKEAQIDGIRNLFSEHVVNLDFAVISDFTIPGAFDKALENVTYIFHLASPMPGKGSDFETGYLNPAVQGTIALLDAAKKVDTVKRVVIVSSLLALVPLDALVTQKFVARGKSLRLLFLFRLLPYPHSYYLKFTNVTSSRGPQSVDPHRRQDVFPRRPKIKWRSEVPCLQDPCPPRNPRMDSLYRSVLSCHYTSPNLCIWPQLDAKER
jgi:FlaA1/EpsC-like NDP-sugar epimerase